MIREITKPYTPNIITRYPRVTSAAEALVVGGIVTAGCVTCFQHSQNSFVKTVCAGALGMAAAGSFYLYDQYIKQSDDLVDCILTDPLKGLNACHKVVTQFNKAVESQNIKNEKNSSQFISKIKMLVSDYKQQWPIFFLGEL